MKFKVNQDHFSNGLQQVIIAARDDSKKPILSNVLIEAWDEGHISLTTTNLDLGIRCRIKAEVLGTGSITLPVRKLATIVCELPVNEVYVETSKNNQAKITSGESEFLLSVIDPSEFPSDGVLTQGMVYEFFQKEIVKMLKSVSHAQSSDKNRPILNCVYFNFSDEKLTLVATDGRRLGLTALDLIVNDNYKGSLMLPAKTVVELERLLGRGEKVKIVFNDR